MLQKMRAIVGVGLAGQGGAVCVAPSSAAAAACPCPAITQGHQPRRLISGPRSPAQLPPPTGGAPPQMRRLRSTDARLSCSRPPLLLLGLF